MNREISSSTALYKENMARPTLLPKDPGLANTNGEVPLAQYTGPNFDSNSISRSQTSSATLRPSSLPITASLQNVEAFGSHTKEFTSGDSDDQDCTTGMHISRSESIVKAARLLGESEETIIRQQPYLPLQHHKQKASPDNTDRNRKPRDKVRRPDRDPNSPASTSAIHPTRTRSAPASTKTSLAGDKIQPRKTRSRTVPDTSSAAAGLVFNNSVSTPTTPPSGWERRRSSVAKLVIEKARSVKKMFTDRRKCTEPNSPVIKEGRKEEEKWDGDTNTDRRGFSLDLPLHVSQDKSELEYIQRKNMDAMLGRNSDVAGMDYLEEEQGTWTGDRYITCGTSREDSYRPTMTSNDSLTSASRSAQAIRPLSAPTLKAITTVASQTKKEGNWKDIKWQPEPSNGLCTGLANAQRPSLESSATARDQSPTSTGVETSAMQAVRSEEMLKTAPSSSSSTNTNKYFGSKESKNVSATMSQCDEATIEPIRRI
ncbi:hypothetical protein DL95DRAFT_38560 [Leptodontidium sp. 2 PMI_412]|nr:hypothetical protein DL95DRAFT_38560 [Leptodontidium sp. 2 PMI_412]